MSAINTKNHYLGLRRLVSMAVVMFGFGFALVPLYDVFCKISGANGKDIQKDLTAARKPQDIDLTREVKVEYLGQVSKGLNIDFRPKLTDQKIHPGALTTVTYRVINRENHTVFAQAVPSIAPGVAAKFFKKIVCFCFTQQEFKAGETKDIEVRFYVDPAIPKEIRTLTLSYVFYRSDTAAETSG